MNCTNCGRENADTAKFCGGCGAALSSPQATGDGQLPMVKFSAAVAMGFRRATDFTGRSTRAEYWWFTLFLVIGSLFAWFIDSAVGTAYEPSDPLGSYISLWVGGLVSGVWFLATLIPDLAVGARRLHDINKSAWWLLLIPTVFGSILLIFWAVKKGDKEENAYGSDPRQSPSTEGFPK